MIVRKDKKENDQPNRYLYIDKTERKVSEGRRTYF